MPIDGNNMHGGIRTMEARHDEPRRDYTKNELCDIGWALKQMHDGQRVRRVGWNGKGMWLMLVNQWSFGVAGGRPMPDNWAGVLPFIVMFTADGSMVPWLCSQTDLLALDWQVA